MALLVWCLALLRFTVMSYCYFLHPSWPIPPMNTIGLDYGELVFCESLVRKSCCNGRWLPATWERVSFDTCNLLRRAGTGP